MDGVDGRGGWTGWMDGVKRAMSELLEAELDRAMSRKMFKRINTLMSATTSLK